VTDHSQEAEEPAPPLVVPLLLATRPKTLLAAIVPVWLGFVLAQVERGQFDQVLFGFTLAATLCIQIATNFFNDAIDCRKGADTSKRLGPRRMAGSGALAPEVLMIAAVTVAMLAVTLSLPLIAARGWPIVLIGVPSLFFSFGYTGGPWPLAYRGLGELFVFVFFGLIAVAGACFVGCGEWLPASLVLGAQVGLLATVLIAVNNARDIEEDRAADKRTLASRRGIGFARAEVAFCCIAPYLIGVVWIAGFGKPVAAVIPVLGIGLSGYVALGVARNDPGVIYNKYLALSALALLNFAVLMSVALYLG
jgi:1,4-dihydroxy-2-naphthoate octaprenyltransferase